MKPPPLPEHFILTTTDRIEGKTVEKYLGPVSGFSARNHGVKGAFRLATGRGEIESYTTLVSETQMAAVDHLVQEARSIGADAVIALRVDIEFQDAICIATSFGTAVMLG
ncbi:MAG: heavy metal-binding domain-containing protein [Verrucomicrobiaceae bacterium]